MAETSLARLDRAALEQRLVTTDAAGHTMLNITAKMREDFNVLAPTMVMVQSDPFFKPGFTVIELDPDPEGDDFYPVEKAWDSKSRSMVPKKLGATKVALRKLMSAAGIEFDGDRSHGEEFGEAVELTIGTRVIRKKPYRYKAVGYLRKSDGTKAELTGEHEWHPDRVLITIEDDVANATQYNSDNPKYPEGPARDREILSRFLRSWEFRAPMSKTKAQNMILRDALQMPQKFDPERARKPFFVVGFNFTPGDDPDMRKVVAALAGADISNIFGATAAVAAPALPEGADEDAEVPADVAEAEAEWEEVPADDMPGSVDADLPCMDASDSDEELLRTLQSRVFEHPTHPLGGKSFAAIISDTEHGGMGWFEQMSKWADEKAASGSPMSGSTIDLIADVKEFIRLLKANGGELL